MSALAVAGTIALLAAVYIMALGAMVHGLWPGPEDLEEDEDRVGR